MTDQNGLMRIADSFFEAEELSDYRRMVEAASSSDRAAVFGNGTLGHARIVIETLFKSARSTVQLMADHESDDIYSDHRVRDEVVDFLARGGSLQIIREPHHEIANHEEFWQLVKGHENVEIRDLPKAYHNALRFHLLIADRKNVRVEDDRKLRKAIVGFNDLGLASSSVELFDSTWGRCIPHAENLELA